MMIEVDAPDVTLHDVIAARAAVYRHLVRTPLLRYTGLSELVGAEVLVKHENHHAVGAFKVRGGVNLAESLDAKARAAGLFTASTGNHGQSIAYAGSVTGTKVTVATPEHANEQKVAAMKRLGAEVVAHGADFDEAREWAEAESERRGGCFIGPTDPRLVAGVGTYTLEILEDCPQVDVILVPVGAGSGACGVCVVAKSIRPSIEVIGVQSSSAPTQQLTWKAGEAVTGDCTTRAEGVATRVPFSNSHRLLGDRERGLDDFVLVSDDAMDDAVRLMLEHTHNLAEHSGAAPLAAAIDLRDRLAGKTVVLVQSGGNMALDALGKLLAARS